MTATDDLSESAGRAEAAEILRSINASEVDAVVVSDDGTSDQMVVPWSEDRPYRMFVENMRDGAATVSSTGHIVYANRRLAELLSFPVETIVGSAISVLVSESGASALELLTDPGRHGTSLELELVDGRGRTIPVLVGASPLSIDGHHLRCLTFADLSTQRTQAATIARMGAAGAVQTVDLQRARDDLARQSTHDALTGLPNRDLLVERVEEALDRARRVGGCTALLSVDLDHFKQVNDAEGHDAGDRLLRSVAGRLVDAVRPLDTVARLGGDEFVVLADDVDGLAQSVELGMRMAAELRRTLDPSAGVERVRGSVGVTVSHDGAGSAVTLLHEADTAMNHAKGRGGDRVEVFDPAWGHRVDRLAAAGHMLGSALADDRVEALFQPVIAVGPRTLTGFEARARIVAEDGDTILPRDAVDSAAGHGLEVPLGTRMLHLACRQAATWPPGGPAGSRSVSVAVPPRLLDIGNLPAVVAGVLGATGLPPHRLRLEVAGTTVLGLRPALVEQLRELRSLGVEIGLDEFGSGAASLTHLLRLPLTFVKVDRSAVHGIETSEDDLRLVTAVVELAANLGLRSVAEGVEHRSQLERLGALGCVEAQGPLFARHVAARDVASALARETW